MQLSAEQALEDKLIATLEPVTGVGNVRASVTLDYDAQAAEETDENYDPDEDRDPFARAQRADFGRTARRCRGSGHRLQCAQHPGCSRVSA